MRQTGGDHGGGGLRQGRAGSTPDQYNASNTLLQKVVYKNDAFGNRISMAVTVGGTTTTTRFALDGWNPALSGQDGNANWNVWADLDGSNNLVTRYLRGDAVLVRPVVHPGGRALRMRPQRGGALGPTGNAFCTIRPLGKKIGGKKMGTALGYM